MPSWACSKQLIVSNVWEIFLQPFLLVIFDVLVLATNLAIWPPKKDLLSLWSHFLLACLFSTLLPLNCWVENSGVSPGLDNDQMCNHCSPVLLTNNVYCCPGGTTQPVSAIAYSEKSSEPSHFQEKCALLWCMLNTAALAPPGELWNTTASSK